MEDVKEQGKHSDNKTTAGLVSILVLMEDVKEQWSLKCFTILLQ